MFLIAQRVVMISCLVCRKVTGCQMQFFLAGIGRTFSSAIVCCHGEDHLHWTEECSGAGDVDLEAPCDLVHPVALPLESNLQS